MGAAGRVEIRSVQPSSLSPDPITRVTVIDESRGIVLEQHLYNQTGQRLATAVLSKHQRDYTSGVTMPRHINIVWPPTQFELNLELTDLQINRLGASPQQLFARPAYPGYKDVDLAGPDLPPGLLPPTGAMSTGLTSAPPPQQSNLGGPGCDAELWSAARQLCDPRLVRCRLARPL